MLNAKIPRCRSRWEVSATPYNKKEVDSIGTQKKTSPEQAKKELAEQLWLSYYNQVLFEAGLITETERNRMKNKISALAPSASNGADRSILT